jgi:DnaJ domain
MTDLTKIIKRLELIKNLISLEEDEDIVEQITKLKHFQTNEDVQNIIALLLQKAYSNTIITIDIFLSKHNQLTIYTDPEIEALRFEAKILEKQIQDRSNEKAELDKLIHEFNVRHNHELGRLIIELLLHRKEQSKGTPQQQEAEKDYQEFYNNYEAGKKEIIAILTKEEQKELKNNYRKASKLCHPDLVNDYQKEVAHKIFVELNEAYQKNDIAKVIEILNTLKHGDIFTSKADSATEKQTLLTELKRLRQKLNRVNDAIAHIKNSDTFITINSIADLDDYFIQTKQQLEEQLKQLKNGK